MRRSRRDRSRLLGQSDRKHILTHDQTRHCEQKSMDDEPEDPPLNWPAIILLAIGVLGALIVGMGNVSSCWHIMP